MLIGNEFFRIFVLLLIDRIIMEKDENIKILICTHKLVPLPVHEYFFPIHGGAALASEALPYVRDDTGDNISMKNRNYCELTAHYWFWKNCKCDIVGLNHYRRFFNFGHLHDWVVPERYYCDLERFMQRPYSFPENLSDLLNQYDIIKPPAHSWPYRVATQYAIFHVVNDLNVLREVIRDITPDYLVAFDHLFYHSNSYSQYNMFIMRWELFDTYSEWLFSVLFEVEKRIKISGYVDQARVFGYMAERLLTVFVEKNSLRVLSVPVDIPLCSTEGDRISGLHYKLRFLKHRLLFKWLNL